MSNVIVQGLGFVGSATAVAVAMQSDKNNNPLFKVYGIELKNKNGSNRVKMFNKGIFPFKTNDKSMQPELKKSILKKNLLATFDENIYKKADYVLVSINCDLEKRETVNLNKFKKAFSRIIKLIKINTLVIIQSTVPPGTCERILYPEMQKIFKARGFDQNKALLSHSYERVMPGKYWLNSVINSYRVYSGINKEAAMKCRKFFSKVINTKKYPLIKLQNTNSSELSKVLENSYRAVNIAFIEEWSRFSEDIGVDLYDVLKAIKTRDTHNNIRYPGFGVGGYCLTKDPLFGKIGSKQIFNLKNHNFLFSSNAIKINNNMPLVSVDKIVKYFNGSIKSKKILLLGASYREDVEDTRFSPSEVFYKEVKRLGAKIDVYDPLINFWNEIKLKCLDRIPLNNNYDIVLLAVKHKQFQKIVFNHTTFKKKKLLVFDSNNILSKKQVKLIKDNINFKYMSIGRG